MTGRKRMSARECIGAVVDWLKQERHLTVGEVEIFDLDGRLWLQLSNLVDEDGVDEPIPFLRGMLWFRNSSPLDEGLTSDTVIMTLYERDPTPRDREGSFAMNPSGGIWAMAVTPTRGEIIVREAFFLPTSWDGGTLKWPFPN